MRPSTRAFGVDGNSSNLIGLRWRNWLAALSILLIPLVSHSQVQVLSTRILTLRLIIPFFRDRIQQSSLMRPTGIITLQRAATNRLQGS